MVLIDTDNPTIGYAIQRKDGEEGGPESKHQTRKIEQNHKNILER